jgi:lipopolysaccharide export system protein LptA
MRRGFWLAALAAALIVSTAAAQGQQPAPGSPAADAQGQDQGQPIQIDAKSLEVHDKQKQATFTGAVKVVQGDTTMTCDTLVVYYDQEMGIGGGGAQPSAQPVVASNSTSDVVPNTQNIRLIEAHGNVTVLTKDQSASGDLGVYDPLTKMTTLTGNVVVTQGKNVIHGGRVVVNTVTGNAHVEPAPGTPDGRVRALIIPNKDSQGGGLFPTIGPGPGK